MIRMGKSHITLRGTKAIPNAVESLPSGYKVFSRTVSIISGEIDEREQHLTLASTKDILCLFQRFDGRFEFANGQRMISEQVVEFSQQNIALSASPRLVKRIHRGASLHHHLPSISWRTSLRCDMAEQTQALRFMKRIIEIGEGSSCQRSEGVGLIELPGMTERFGEPSIVHGGEASARQPFDEAKVADRSAHVSRAFPRARHEINHDADGFAFFVGAQQVGHAMTNDTTCAGSGVIRGQREGSLFQNAGGVVLFG